MHLQLASPADAGRIAAVLFAAFRDFQPLYTPEGFRATTPSAREVSDRFAEGPIWTATDGETMIGTVSALERGLETYIRSMAVIPDARGRGVGAQLLSAAQAYAEGRGSLRLTLTTAPFLAAAIRLYERAGFQRADGMLDLGGTPVFAMTKQLRGGKP